VDTSLRTVQTHLCLCAKYCGVSRRVRRVSSVDDLVVLALTRLHFSTDFPRFVSPGWRIHGSVEDTKLSTNKQHSVSLSRTPRVNMSNNDKTAGYNSLKVSKFDHSSTTPRATRWREWEVKLRYFFGSANPLLAN
jgi:hypothetical protein